MHLQQQYERVKLKVLKKEDLVTMRTVMEIILPSTNSK